MNNFMNQMNQMKHSTGCWHEFENPSNFFIFDGCKGAFYVHFASCGSLICLYERFEAVMCGVSAYLMNHMKVYEVRRFKKIFGIGLFCFGYLMNMEKGLTS